MMPSLNTAPQHRTPTLTIPGVSARDQVILRLLRRSLAHTTHDFPEVLRALQQIVAAMIPAGRTYLLGTYFNGPIVGSLLSGVGVCESASGALIVRVGREGLVSPLGRLLP